MSKKRKQPSLSSSIFGSTPSSLGSSGTLKDSIFGAASKEASTAAGLFGSASNTFDKAVKDRIEKNKASMSMLAKQQQTEEQQSTKQPPSPAQSEASVKEIMARRKSQSEHAFLENIRIRTPFPANGASAAQADGDNKDNDDMVLPPEVQLAEIADVVRDHGFAVIPNVVSNKLLEKCSVKAMEIEEKLCNALDGAQGGAECWRSKDFRYWEVAGRCGGRMDTRYQTSEAPFNGPEILENATLLPVVNSLLGGDAAGADESHTPKLVYAGLILSFPGSQDQPFHQDGMPLFPELGGTVDLPPYALNIFLPLADDDTKLEAGPTEFIPQSHRMPESQVMQIVNGETPSEEGDGIGVVGPKLEQGDALLYDYRVCHRGTANLTSSTTGEGRVRRILYLMYARPWFKEHMNFGDDKLL